MDQYITNIITTIFMYIAFILLSFFVILYSIFFDAIFKGIKFILNSKSPTFKINKFNIKLYDIIIVILSVIIVEFTVHITIFNQKIL